MDRHVALALAHRRHAIGTRVDRLQADSRELFVEGQGAEGGMVVALAASCESERHGELPASGVVFVFVSMKGASSRSARRMLSDLRFPLERSV